MLRTVKNRIRSRNLQVRAQVQWKYGGCAANTLISDPDLPHMPMSTAKLNMPLQPPPASRTISYKGSLAFMLSIKVEVFNGNSGLVKPRLLVGGRFPLCSTPTHIPVLRNYVGILYNII